MVDDDSLGLFVAARTCTAAASDRRAWDGGEVKPYYEHNGIVIYHGDCREILPTLKADCVVTDPPYGVNLGSHKSASETRPGFLVKGAYASYDDSQANLESVVVPSVVAALGMAKRGAVFCAPTKVCYFPEPSAVGGVYLPAGCGRTCWGFQNLALVMFYGIAPELQKGAKATMIRSTESAEANAHPCPKPFGWMRWLVNLASLHGETIIDPFMGSGTTLVAAKLEGRKAIGIEIEEKYCEIAVKRLAQDVLQFP